MISEFYINTCWYIGIASKTLALIGLALDMYGVYRLFHFEPEPLEKPNESIFNATIPGWSEEEKNQYRIKELLKKIDTVMSDTKALKTRSVLFKRIIIIGFFLQAMAIGLTYICT
ncbi:hypothetical protein AAU57_14775 [Nonlabens sp. YIK11]|uniref:hypothetical protein n=1 Tax=Nonlabens sp. YIK11 TaxID=1453349 RepID=UPI0006DCAE8A|nr:hypothetical protein [Nonlabens sp. YIK11]KQC31851.1 hypothetical protein AAU57_14655 [Nonlabens sp. YIK11]KQC31872.1 hypothetical protein AAU57_14775 [Nonlabens sp. YIK11]